MNEPAPRQPSDRPSERTWLVPTTVVDAEGAEVPALEQAQYALNEAAVILMRLGGAITIASKRVELPPQGRYPGRYETEMLVIKHVSFVAPAQPKEAPVEPESAEAEPE